MSARSHTPFPPIPQTSSCQELVRLKLCKGVPLSNALMPDCSKSRPCLELASDGLQRLCLAALPSHSRCLIQPASQESGPVLERSPQPSAPRLLCLQRFASDILRSGLVGGIRLGRDWDKSSRSAYQRRFLRVLHWLDGLR